MPISLQSDTGVLRSLLKPIQMTNSRDLFNLLTPNIVVHESSFKLKKKSLDQYHNGGHW